VTDFLATDEDDSEVVGRLKNALTDAGGGVLFEGFIAALRGVRAMRTVGEVHAREAVHPDADVNLDAIKTAADEVPAVSPEGTPQADLKPAPLVELDSTVKALDEKQLTYGEMAEGEAEVSLRERLGITEEKLTAFREQVQRGEIHPEAVSEVIGMNPDRINWSGVRDARDMVGLLNGMARVFDDATAGAAGYKRVSIETIAQHASDMGGSYEESLRLWERVKDAPAAVMAQRATLMASAAKLQRLATTVRGAHTAADLLEFVAHERRHALLQITARGTRAEIGRALRVMREGVTVNEDALKLANARRLREMRKATTATTQADAVQIPERVKADEADQALQQLGMSRKQVEELADHVANSKDLAELNATARAGLWHTTTERLATLYINNILSGLPTMALNVSSGFYKMVENAAENFGSAALGMVRGGDRFDRIAATRSTVAALTSWRAAWKAAGTAWREGIPQTDIVAKSEAGSHAGSVITGQAKVDAVLTAPSRAILTIDEFFKHIFYRQELTARAVEIAAEAARLETTRGGQDEVFARVVRETLDNPPDDLVLDAIEKARYSTFQSNLESKFAAGLTKMTNETPLLKFVVPFIKTPLNIMKQGLLERTPLALARQQFWREVKAGGRTGRTAAFRAMLGTAAIGTVWHLSADGRITGSRKGVKGNKNTADLADVPPYSVKIGDTWYQYNRLDPIGTVLGLVVDLRIASDELTDRATNDISTDNPELSDVFASTMAILNENMLDKTFFKGLSDFFSAMSGDDGVVTNYANGIAGNLIPFSSMQRSLAKTHDEYAREAWTLMDKLQASLPGMSDDLPLRRDVLGRPMKNAERLGADWISPFLTGKDDPEAAGRALAEIGMSYRMPSKDIAGVHLDSKQYSRLLEVRGSYVKEQLDEWLSTGEWQSLTKYQKSDTVRRWFMTATREAERTVRDESPELDAILEANREERSALRHGIGE
jgi:hypothetical protein